MNRERIVKQRNGILATLKEFEKEGSLSEDSGFSGEGMGVNSRRSQRKRELEVDLVAYNGALGLPRDSRDEINK